MTDPVPENPHQLRCRTEGQFGRLASRGRALGTDVTVIANPAAAHGRLGRQIPRLLRRLAEILPGFQYLETQKQGDGSLLARKALESGARLIVVAGGNGTVNEVADGLLSSGRPAQELPELGLIPVGVGIDFARSLALPKSMDEVFARLADNSRTRLVDAGRTQFRDPDGSARDRHFMNVASAGISAAVVGSVNGVRRGFLPGPAVFFAKTIGATMRYRFRPAIVHVDGELVSNEPTALIAVANGQFFGGGMAIAPDARLDDGKFDVVVVRGTSKLYLIDNMNRIYSGSHRSLPEVKIVRGRSVRIETPDDAPAIPFEIDGETPGLGPLQMEIVPGALRIRA